MQITGTQLFEEILKRLEDEITIGQLAEVAKILELYESVKVENNSITVE